MKEERNAVDLTLILVLAGLIGIGACKQSEDKSNSSVTADIIIYEGASAAISAAVEAKRSGKIGYRSVSRYPFGRPVIWGVGTY